MNIVVFKDQRDFLGKRHIAYSPSCFRGNDEMRQVNAKKLLYNCFEYNRTVLK